MSYTFRPAKRENSPLIVGLSGPTKSGKTFSALRLATGLAEGGPIAMVNAEGARGRQYADRFSYLIEDIEPPYRPERYTEIFKAALDVKPAVVIVDSASHMHDGPGGMLEYHEAELDRLAGNDSKKRQRSTWSAWIRPKAAENEFIYAMLEADCHVILCFRAKQKLKIIPGKDPIELGWQPIAGDRVSFETIFTLTLPPHSKGVPDLSISDMREPFDSLVPKGKPIDEELGKRLAEWSRGSTSDAAPAPNAALAAEGAGGSGNEPVPAASDTDPEPSSSPRGSDGPAPNGGSGPIITRAQRARLFAIAREYGVEKDHLRTLLKELTGSESTAELSVENYDSLVALIQSRDPVNA